jgi:glycosyltransferase involved in cell wall biosynthesis
MRIAHVTATLPPYWGGTGNVAWYNALGLARLGHEVHVFTVEQGGEPLDAREVRVHRLPALVRIGNAPLLPGLVPALAGFDVIHLHYPFFFGAEMVWAASRLSGIPYVLTYHNALIGDGARALLFRAWERTLGRLVVAGSRKLLAVSLDHARGLPLLRAMPPGRLAELPNGVDVERFHPAVAADWVREQLRIERGRPMVLFVAALDRAHYFKGLGRLLEAVARIRERQIALVVVGDGDQRREYEAQADALGIRSLVHFVGAVAHAALPPYFAAADVLALPTSPPESFGVVLVEALACGTPVVASDIPGVRAVVRATGGGILVPPGDVAALAAALADLAADPARRAALGRRGRRAVEERYAWPAIAKRLEAIYEEVCADVTRARTRRAA